MVRFDVFLLVPDSFFGEVRNIAFSRYPIQNAIEKLCRDLNLPRPDNHDQDWELVVVDEMRIDEFIDYYQYSASDNEVRFTLMIILIGSFDDAVLSGNFDVAAWEKVKRILISQRELHAGTIAYWSCGEDSLEDSFRITPYIREVACCIENCDK